MIRCITLHERIILFFPVYFDYRLFHIIKHFFHSHLYKNNLYKNQPLSLYWVLWMHRAENLNRGENRRRIKCGYISLEIYVRTISAQHLTKDICLTREILCGHSAVIVRTYISRNICPHYILNLGRLLFHCRKGAKIFFVPQVNSNAPH